MNAKHTPGPWETWGDRGYGALNGVQVRSSRTSLVLAVAIGDVPELDSEANARLIAAAPDMFEALLVAQAALSDGAFEGPHVDAALRSIDAALSKAQVQS